MTYAPLSPQGRVILISGANRGIGRAIAERLYADGYSLGLGARRPETLKPLLDRMEKARAFGHAYDASSPRSAADWVAATAAHFGRVDGVVNNAGIGHDFSVESGEESQLDEMWEVNTKGPLRVIRAAYPFLKASGSGRVINIVSLSGKAGDDRGLHRLFHEQVRDPGADSRRPVQRLEARDQGHGDLPGLCGDRHVRGRHFHCARGHDPARLHRQSRGHRSCPAQHRFGDGNPRELPPGAQRLDGNRAGGPLACGSVG